MVPPFVLSSSKNLREGNLVVFFLVPFNPPLPLPFQILPDLPSFKKTFSHFLFFALWHFLGLLLRDLSEKHLFLIISVFFVFSFLFLLAFFLDPSDPEKYLNEYLIQLNPSTTQKQKIKIILRCRQYVEDDLKFFELSWIPQPPPDPSDEPRKSSTLPHLVNNLPSPLPPFIAF
jgi:hypothetical protein